MKKVFFILLFLTSHWVFSQGWEWRTPVNGVPLSVKKDSQNNVYACIDYSDSISIAKFDSFGNLSWIRSVIGIDLYYGAFEVDQFDNIILLINTGLPVTLNETTFTPVGEVSLVITKMSPGGNILYFKMFDNGYFISGSDLFINSSNEYYISGGFRNDLDFNGNLISGDSLVSGLLLKTDSLFNVIWNETAFFYSGGYRGYITEVAEDLNGKLCLLTYAAAGALEFNGFQFPGAGDYICFLDSSRNVINAVMLSGYMDFIAFRKLMMIGEDAFLIETMTHHGSSSGFTKIESSGGVTHYDIASNFVAAEFQGDLYYAGIIWENPNTSPVYFSMIGSWDSNLQQNFQFSDTMGSVDYFQSMEIIDSSNYYLGGNSDDIGGTFIGKFNLELAIGINENSPKSFKIYPNPTTCELIIENLNGEVLSIYNFLGQEISRQKIGSNNVINVSELPPSVYIIEISGSRKVFVKQ
jgi:hypothetical protein